MPPVLVKCSFLSYSLDTDPSSCPVCVAVGAELCDEGDASDENDEAEFFDAMEESPAFITVTASGNIQRK